MQSSNPIALIMSVVLLAGAGSAAASDDALARAIRRGSDKSIPKLIADGTGINAADDKGRSPLYYAAVRGDGDLIDQLLAKGAVVDAADPAGDTPLIVLMRNTFDVAPQAAALLAHGAQINASNRAGRTPLMEAIIRSPGVTDFRSETAMVKALLDAGANPDLFDSEGETAAHHAAIVGEPTSMVKIVLAASRDPRTKDRQGLDPTLLAVEHKHPALARSLFAQGFAPVAAPPRDPTQTDKDATKIDDHARIDESAFELYGDWLSQQAKPAEAVEAYRLASTFIQPAIEENDRAAGAIRLKLADDEHQRRNDRAATFAANIAGAAIGVATGVNLVTLQNFKGTVEADREMLKSIADDDAALALRRDELQKKFQPT